MQRIGTLFTVLFLVLGAAACGGDDDVEPVEFGSGELPETVPGGFPLPDGSAIGSTLIDRVNHRTEFAVNARSDLSATVAFFTVELVNEGYVVDRSDGTDLNWEVEFSKGSLRGEIVLSALDSGTAAVVSLNRS